MIFPGLHHLLNLSLDIEVSSLDISMQKLSNLSEITYQRITQSRPVVAQALLGMPAEALYTNNLLGK